VEITKKYNLVNTPTLVSSHQLLHFMDYEKSFSDPIIQLMPYLYTGVVWSPIEGIPIYRNMTKDRFDRIQDSILKKKKKLLLKLWNAGTKLHIGSDIQQPFVVPGASIHQEMNLFSQVGIPIIEIWKIATKIAGEDLGKEKLGTIQEGAEADLLIFSKDPTKSLDSLDSLKAVISQGKLYRMDDIQKSIDEWIKHFNGFVFEKVSVTAARMFIKNSIVRNN